MPNRTANLFAASACVLFLAAVSVPAILWDRVYGRHLLAAGFGLAIGAAAALCTVGAAVTKQRRIR